MPFIPHTATEVKTMLQSIGVANIDELFDEIPDSVPVANFRSIEHSLTEMEMMQRLSERAREDELSLCFLGAGSYDHHIPAAVWDLATRGEFLTAYTPYQAEASQGTLQLLYEFQTMMASLASLDVANASLYDGGSGLGEAILMAVRSNRSAHSRKIVIGGAVNPFYVKTANTLVRNQGIELVQVPHDNGLFDPLQCDVDDPSAVVVQQPNFYGLLENVDAISNWAAERKALLIAVVNPLTLAVLKPPGEWGASGADISCGDGQPLGVPMASGGPSFGFLCSKMKHVRQMPGRIVGRTLDANGDVGYTLTLQAREQHIRRAKATSNICTNQGLLVTAATIYMSIMGVAGLRHTASRCHENTNYLVAQLEATGRAQRAFSSPYFHECVIRCAGNVDALTKTMISDHGILAGYPLGDIDPTLEDCLLLCATERRTREEIDLFVELFSRILKES
ncbi:MAG: aminomethyl-transferring glycine dehydrogenase subunit GcvPA [Gammaproteobacteria bacterium]|nr:aminomethyl-transferring glycine dehydrogenase subunit GcvPA [Gammaproteobacteria bacterium]MYF37333.1 aminomethyl-transferring glycine dehydrogenase subunit GcvPA [Gammaproteobacteria bacterium]